jgi:hypothetical protein
MKTKMKIFYGVWEKQIYFFFGGGISFPEIFFQEEIYDHSRVEQEIGWKKKMKKKIGSDMDVVQEIF